MRLNHTTNKARSFWKHYDSSLIITVEKLLSTPIFARSVRSARPFSCPRAVCRSLGISYVRPRDINHQCRSRSPRRRRRYLARPQEHPADQPVADVVLLGLMDLAQGCDRFAQFNRDPFSMGKDINSSFEIHMLRSIFRTIGNKSP